MQSKKHSLIESLLNMTFGFVFSFAIQLIIYPALNIKITLNQNFTITFVFLLSSVLRSYIIRRVFTRINTKT